MLTAYRLGRGKLIRVSAMQNRNKELTDMTLNESLTYPKRNSWMRISNSEMKIALVRRMLVRARSSTR